MTIRLPSGEKVAADMAPVFPCNVKSLFPFSVFHIMAEFCPPVMSSLPLEENAMQVILSGKFCSDKIFVYVSEFLNIIFLPIVTSRFSDGENPASLKSPEAPVSFISCFPVAASHKKADELSVVTILRLSEENDAESTGAGWGNIFIISPDCASWRIATLSLLAVSIYLLSGL